MNGCQRNAPRALALLVALTSACGGAVATTESADLDDVRRAPSEANAAAVEGAETEAEPHEGADPPEELTDAQIMVFVLAELVDSPAVAAHHVDVSVREGVATLDGRVSHLLAKRHAVEVAKNVRGVRSVIDTLEVAPSGVADARIERAVDNALLFDPAIDPEQLDVTIDDGTATVTGTVASFAESGIVEDVVASVAGVRAVELALEVAPPAERSAEELETDIETAFATSATIDDRLMDVTVDGSEVILSGFVGSAAERDRAVRTAYLAGASSVDDESLLVQWWRRDEMSRTEGEIDDGWIREGIRIAFSIDPRIGDDDHVGVSVRRGIVTLTGVVDDLMSARAARRIAENTSGVLRVYSYLRTLPDPEVTDEMLESRVEARLAGDPYAQMTNITVEVHDGVLTLAGNVHSMFERDRAEEAAAGVDGLIAIENLLDVRTPVRHLSDVELAHDVASKLARDAWVASGSVVVSAVAGIVSLHGTVPNVHAKNRAIDDAYRAGARRVDAEALLIEP